MNSFNGIFTLSLLVPKLSNTNISALPFDLPVWESKPCESAPFISSRLEAELTSISSMLSVISSISIVSKSFLFCLLFCSCSCSCSCSSFLLPFSFSFSFSIWPLLWSLAPSAIIFSPLSIDGTSLILIKSGKFRIIQQNQCRSKFIGSMIY
ncbi:hypothetical protein LELG_02292 [Lodderomyces elongisporus NRRL YB-4239]|uniref:Uncharacterized protein n=1 Tax=Lodderomyces elongisporus (strain ATCC 11503 / CBS 2605 / JCM 1781 / NBRC 1676 / NRRL YB-4239) TaxID=379508 RepID=A5DY55_LODEL|nr:hypothetical protein LELG_02292 [Lodderomyces elongisporus NRRL YB-4239]